ncbi:HAD family phosphatase [Sphingomonas sp. NFR15]|uniref:HAD family hydrolase n=1 Tax=Sphingomonas sp. NFR15 TaxID=1566282 RepID=UPI0008923D01|nr:HAD-IB family phosphatase [Sphingomonas sp. NFR15]SDA24512.1 Haloacid Dehalogenase superfamily, subfamily IB, phosphoserine phosphatase-like [Sphingomonas sp. NFR15]
MIAPRVRISVYDLDRTITSLPTWTPFLLHAARAVAPWRLAALPVVGLVALSRTDRDRRKELMHRLILGPTLGTAAATRLAEDFATRLTRDHIRPGARAQIAADRAEGRRIVIATAAHAFYARAIADRLGVADLVATRAKRDAAGDITPMLDGPNCYGAAKRAMLERWLADAGIAREDAHIRFQSDHVSDAPSFAWADEPIAVNPHARLRALARARGWPIVDWGG